MQYFTIRTRNAKTQEMVFHRGVKARNQYEAVAQIQANFSNHYIETVYLSKDKPVPVFTVKQERHVWRQARRTPWALLARLGRGAHKRNLVRHPGPAYRLQYRRDMLFSYYY